MANKGRRRTEWLISLPTLAWLGLFVVIPTLLVFVIAFRPANPYGGIGAGWTLDTIRALWTPSYLAIAWRTLWISLLTTVICLVLALPAGYTIARASERWRNRLLMLVIIPFWTSFLVRVFAWKSLLHPEGPVKKLLEAVGLAGPQTTLLYHPCGRRPGHGLHLPAVHDPPDLRGRGEVRFPAGRGRPRPRRPAVPVLPQGLPARASGGAS